jgi:hypothetical protein
MADTRSATSREAARNRAQSHFAVAEQRDATVKQMIDSERAAMDAKTAKLRALRLAKEESDRQAAANAPAAPVAAPKKPRKRIVR